MNISLALKFRKNWETNRVEVHDGIVIVYEHADYHKVVDWVQRRYHLDHSELMRIHSTYMSAYSCI